MGPRGTDHGVVPVHRERVREVVPVGRAEPLELLGLHPPLDGPLECVDRAAAGVIEGTADEHLVTGNGSGLAEPLVGLAVRGEELGSLDPSVARALEHVGAARAGNQPGPPLRADDGARSVGGDRESEVIAGLAIARHELLDQHPFLRDPLVDVRRARVGAEWVVPLGADDCHVAGDRELFSEHVRRRAVRARELDLVALGDAGAAQERSDPCSHHDPGNRGPHRGLLIESGERRHASIPRIRETVPS